MSYWTSHVQVPVSLIDAYVAALEGVALKHRLAPASARSSSPTTTIGACFGEGGATCGG
jgi:hypothetical protein